MTDPAPTDLEADRRRRLGALLVKAEQEGATLQFWARTMALVAVEAFFTIVVDWDAAFLYSFSILIVFFIIGLIQYRLVRKGRSPSWLPFVTGMFDIVLLTFMIVGPNPFAEFDIHPAMHLREAGFKYLLIFICVSALSFLPSLTLWLGMVSAVAWTAAVVWVIWQPGTLIGLDFAETLSADERLAIYGRPAFVDVIDQATHVVVILIITGILALVVSRSRRLADDYSMSERARINLARHFSPNVVDELASADEPFGPVRRQDIGVLFADIVGFTNYSEDHPAEQVFDLLRQFHRRMEQVVFDHRGTVDNYIGDCIMATFGVPSPGEDDATRALSCARAMAAAVDDWNRERGLEGWPPVDVRIGCQFGPVILGAVGSERNLSIAVVGDTVNVASRLQTICRELDADICLGGALIEAVRSEGHDKRLAGLVHCGPIALRGRDTAVEVWAAPKSVPAPTTHQTETGLMIAAQ